MKFYNGFGKLSTYLSITFSLCLTLPQGLMYIVCKIKRRIGIMNSFSELREALGLKELPLGVYYTNEKPKGVAPKIAIHPCMIGLLKKARKKR